jgi:hypothetical protein
MGRDVAHQDGVSRIDRRMTKPIRRTRVWEAAGARTAIVIVTCRFASGLEDPNNEDSEDLLDDCDWLDPGSGPAPRWMLEEEL